MNNKLTFSPSLELTDSNLYGGVKYLQDINPSIDLNIGTSASAQVKFTTDTLDSSSIGMQFTYSVKQNGESSFKQVGVFTITDAEKTTGGRYNVTAYDNVSKFDIVIDSWLDNLTFPMTVANFFSSLCTYCGVTPYSTTFTNSTFTFQDNFRSTNMSGRQVLSYIAQVAAGNFIATPDGKIRLKQFATSSSASLDNTKYKTYFYSDFTVPEIEEVFVGESEDDTGVISGSGDNALSIIYNPILFCDTASEIQTQVDNIYNVIKDYTYVPMNIELFQDFNIQVGDLITVNGLETYVFRKEWSSSGVKLICSGQPLRDKSTNNRSAQLNALRGQFLDVKTDVGNLEITAGDLSTRMNTAETNISTNTQGLAQTVRIKPDGVTITNASGDTLVINGGCVDASTINTNNLNMTGRIAWSDLSSATQQHIEDLEPELPPYIQSTYIDFSQVVSPMIKGQEIALQGGVFHVQDLTGTTQYGYVGYGYGYGPTGQIENGVVLAQSSNSTLGSGDYYVLCTESGVKLVGGNSYVAINDNGVFVSNN